MNIRIERLRSKFTCLMLVYLLLGSSAIGAEPLTRVPGVAFLGIGGLSCLELLSKNPILGHEQGKLLHWATGYMSGLATWMKSEGFEASVQWDGVAAKTLKPFLFEYCRTYPKDNIASAIASFYEFRLVPEPIN